MNRLLGLVITILTLISTDATAAGDGNGGNGNASEAGQGNSSSNGQGTPGDSSGSNGQGGGRGNNEGSQKGSAGRPSQERHDADAKIPTDQDVARDAVSRGQALPLDAILASAREDDVGEVLDAKLVRVQGLLLYDLTVLARDGETVRHVFYYARTGQPIGD